MIKNRLIPRVFAALTALALGVLTVSVSSCVKNEEIAVKSVSVDPTSLTLEVGETATISYTLSPDNATNKNVLFLSGNENVATVTDAGLVKAIAPGNTSITVSSMDGPKATVSVTVKDEEAKPVAVTGVTLDKSELTLTEGETATLTATVAPSDATDKTISWSSSNESVAKVADGVVTAVAPGEANITVTTKDGAKSASCKVKVEAKVVAVTGVKLDKTELTLTEGETATLSATVTPGNATDKTITWSSDNESVAKVADGVVTAVAPGTANITVTTKDGNFTAKCAVTVEKKVYKVTGVTLDKNELTLVEGETATLTATVAPENASDKSVTWSSSNESVAKVADGVVTAVAPGEAKITVKTNDGNFTADCAVTVTAKPVPVTGVSLNLKAITITEGETATLTATIEPADATNQNVTWSSDNESVATVADGVVTAVAPGTANITVTTEDGNFTAKCAVTVAAKPVSVTGLSIDPTEITIAEGETATITATVEPADATDKSVTWSSDKESVATVADGVVTAVAPGSAIITVTTTDGGFTAKCNVTVEKKAIPVTSVKFKSAKVSVKTGKTVTLQVEVLPEDATDKSLEWSSNDESIATVDQNGVVTGVAVGSAVVTALNKSSGKSDGCIINVVQGENEITAINANSTPFLLGVECIRTIKPGIDFTVTPEDATYQSLSDFTFSSSNTSVFKVNSKDGTITGVAAGSATLKGMPNKATTITTEQKMRDIKVFKPTAKVTEVMASGIGASGNSYVELDTLAMAVGEKIKVAVYNGSTKITTPNASADKSDWLTTWGVVDVTPQASGSSAWTELTAKKVGDTKVRIALNGDDCWAAVDLIVKVFSANTLKSGDYIGGYYANPKYPEENITSSNPDLVPIGYIKHLDLYNSSGKNYNYYKDTAPALKWTSSNTSVVTVSGNGPYAIVKGVASGSATITATDVKGNKRYYYVKTFTPVTNISATTSRPLSMGVGCKYTMKPGVDYNVNSGATYNRADDFWWTTEDYSYVKVESKTGEITAYSNDSNDSKSIYVKAMPKQDGAQIDYKRVRAIKVCTQWYLQVKASTHTSGETTGRMTNCAGDATLTITKDKSASYQYLIKEGNLKGSYYSVSVGNSSVATATTEKISDGYVVKITGKSAGTTTVRINYHDQDYYFDKTVTVKVQ